MSMPFIYAHPLPRARRNAADRDHQFDSWWRLLEIWLLWTERSRQRAGLRDIADDPHLLSDLGLTRDEAIRQANKPFWR
jgi:uncharacterized protein YjiS (DUF1127 family)